jgi:hypothetical protein
VTAQGNTVTDEKIIAVLSLSSSAASASVSANQVSLGYEKNWQRKAAIKQRQTEAALGAVNES